MHLHPMGAAFLVVGLGLSLAGSAIAGEIVITGPKGNSASSQSSVTRQDNALSVTRTTTYPSGASSSAVGNYTLDGKGGYSGTLDRTNRYGTTNSYQLNGQYSRSKGTRTNAGTIVGPQGGISTYNRTGTCNNGTCAGTGSVTFPNGKTRTTSASGQRLGAGSYTGNVSVTGRNGGTRSGSFSRTR